VLIARGIISIPTFGLVALAKVEAAAIKVVNLGLAAIIRLTEAENRPSIHSGP
jgi:hypothetical protein